jgi:hypothetical protein
MHLGKSVFIRLSERLCCYSDFFPNKNIVKALKALREIILECGLSGKVDRTWLGESPSDTVFIILNFALILV